jgi:hypothetical protein
MLLDRFSIFPAHNALLPTIGCALFLFSCQKSRFANQVFGTWIAVHLGKLSYSIYLWHFVLIVFYRLVSEKTFFNLSENLSLLALTYCVSLFSYHAIERPLRKSWALQSTTRLLSLLVVLYFAGGVTTLTVKYTNGLSNYYTSKLNSEEKAVYNLIKKYTNKDLSLRMIDNGSCIFWATNIDKNIIKRFKSCAEKFGPAKVILGDSHAMNLFNIIGRTKENPFLFGLSQGGCRPGSKKPECHYDDFLNFLSSHHKNISKIIYHQSGSYLLNDWRGMPDSEELFQLNANYVFDEIAFFNIVDYLIKLNEYSEIEWFGPFIEARVNFFEKQNFSYDLTVRQTSIDLFTYLDKTLLNKTSKHSAFMYISMLNTLRFPNDRLVFDECVTFNDVDHFSDCGEEYLANNIVAN